MKVMRAKARNMWKIFSLVPSKKPPARETVTIKSWGILKNFNFWMLRLTKTPILPNCQVPKGQTKFFSSQRFFQKNEWTNSVFFVTHYYDRIVSLVFWKNSRIAKSPLEINWPLMASFCKSYHLRIEVLQKCSAFYCVSFSSERFFWGNKRKYFAHIPHLRGLQCWTRLAVRQWGQTRVFWYLWRPWWAWEFVQFCRP
jgi:hypothetical protein